MAEKTEKFIATSFGEWKISKLLLRFSIPCILSLLVSALYNIVDQIFVGQGVGYLGNAATNVVYPLTVIGLGFALLLGDGSAAWLSLALGKGDKENGAKAIANSLLALLIISLIILITGYLFLDKILYGFGATESCIEYAREYCQIILAGLPFYMLGSAMNSVIRADGSPAFSMISMLVGALINIICDPIAIFALHLGVAGAAWATVLGQVMTFAISLSYFWRSKTFKIRWSSFRFAPRLLYEASILGISSFITQVSIVITCIVTNNVMVSYGAASEYGSDIPLAAMGIVMKVFSIIVAIVVGISIGGQPIIGYNYGAKKYGRVLETLKYILISCAVVGAIATILFESIPQYIILIFGAEGDEYTKFAVLCFRIYLGTILITSLQKASCIFLQSIGKPKESILLSLSRDTIFLIPAVLILPIYFGIKGALWSAPIADGLAGVLTAIMIIVEWKKIRKLEKEQNLA